MTNKTINISRDIVITPAMENAMIKSFSAFVPYDGEDLVTAPKRDHLGSVFTKGVSCDHKWKLATPTDDVAVWFRKNFEEEAVDPGEYCATCGATCLRENGKIWAYDATSRFYGRLPNTRKQKR